MERRHRVPSGWDGSINCRHCGVPVHLDRDEILPTEDDVWLMTCASCGLEFAVRYGDRDLPQAQAAEDLAMPEEGRKRWWSRRGAASSQP
jgi:hypothetical protein